MLSALTRHLRRETSAVAWPLTADVDHRFKVMLARLTTFNSVLITSHQAFLTQEALGNIADTTLENIREFEQGRRIDELTNHVFYQGD